MLNIRFRERTNTWPGFVDLFSNLVIILIFLLILFVFLWTTTSVFNRATGARTIAELKQENESQAITIQQITADGQEARRKLIMAQAELENLESDNAELANELNEMDLSVEDLITAYETQVEELTQLLAQAQADKERTAELEQERRELQSQMEAQRASLSDKLLELQSALDAAEEKSNQAEVRYVEMSARLNKALADKVAELNDKIAELDSVSKYQSAFYKAISEALDGGTAIRADGDRFIVSSDILFPSGSYNLTRDGREQLRTIAGVIKDFEDKIPSNINWIIRVDGHTDSKKVIAGTHGYSNNTELSLRRATAVADALAGYGVSKRRLLPSGFGDMYPVETGNTPADLQKNRRIELQLTNR